MAISAGRIPIVVVSAHENPMLMESAKALGLAGFIYKSKPSDDLARDIRRVADGQTSFPPIAAGTDPASLRDRIANPSGAQLRVLTVQPLLDDAGAECA